MYHTPQGTGWIEVICGPMFSGKTTELLRRLNRARMAGKSYSLFKPAIDSRYSSTDVVSHDRYSMPAHTIDPGLEFLTSTLGSHRSSVIGIDEVQFFTSPILVEQLKMMADQGKIIIVSGLDQDYRGVGFGPMPALLAEAEYVTKLSAVCVQCGNPAGRTHRILGGINQVEVGGVDRYEARCRRCHEAK